MLTPRLATGVIVGLAALASFFFLPPLYFKLLIALILLIAANEWLNMLKLSTWAIKTALLTLFALCFALTWRYPTPFIYLSLLIWPVLLACLLMPLKKLDFLKNKVISLIMAMGILSSSLAAMGFLQESSAFVLCYLVVTTGIADSGAYFCGKQWGAHPLAKTISPNKTLEGVLGALCAGGLCAIGLLFLLPLPQNQSLFSYFLIGMAAIVFAVMGDLVESLFKRLNQIKDSGTLLPGHGGVLDRMDSYFAVIPLCTLLWTMHIL